MAYQRASRTVARPAGTEADQRQPPPYLGPPATRLWQKLVLERARSQERLALLEIALSALDRADQAREIVAREGLVVTSERSGLSRLHPAIRIETAARAEFLKCGRILGFESNDVEDDRYL